MSGSEDSEKGFLGRSNSFWIGLTGVCTVLILIVAYATYKATEKSNNGNGGNGGNSSNQNQTTPPPTPPNPSPVPVTYYFSFNDASQYPCSDEGSIHSVAGGYEAAFTFYNDSSTYLQVIWLDYNGARYTHGSLAPGASWTADTYAEDVWMIADEASTCEGIFDVAGNGGVTITS
jgi:hypothetical protein